MYIYSLAFYYSIFIFTLVKEITRYLFSYTMHSVNTHVIMPFFSEYTYKVNKHITVQSAPKINSIKQIATLKMPKG